MLEIESDPQYGMNMFEMGGGVRKGELESMPKDADEDAMSEEGEEDDSGRKKTIGSESAAANKGSRKGKAEAGEQVEGEEDAEDERMDVA